MASIQVASATGILSQNGGTNGTVKLATLDGFILNAYCYIISSTQPSKPCIILGTDAEGAIILGKAVDIGVRGNDFSLVDTSVYLVADNAQLSQPQQLVDAIINLSPNNGGTAGAGGNGPIPYYVPSGNLLVGNDFNPMHYIPPGDSGSVLMSDGLTWYAGLGSGGPPSGNAGGDLGSTYPNPSVVKLQGRSISSSAPSNGQTLVWNGTAWAPAVQAGGSPGCVSAFGGPYAGIPAGTPVAVDSGVLVAADAGVPAKMPCVGFYSGSGTNLIQFAGPETTHSGLTVGVDYYVAVGGGITKTPPSAQYSTVQVVAHSYSTTGLFVTLFDPTENG